MCFLFFYYCRIIVINLINNLKQIYERFSYIIFICDLDSLLFSFSPSTFESNILSVTVKFN